MSDNHCLGGDAEANRRVAIRELSVAGNRILADLNRESRDVDERRLLTFEALSHRVPTASRTRGAEDAIGI